MDKIEEIFSLTDYNNIVKNIKNKVLFKFEVGSKELKFCFQLQECDSGYWKDNLMCSFGASYKTSGFSHPFNYDGIPSYEDICEEVNNIMRWYDKGVRS